MTDVVIEGQLMSLQSEALKAAFEEYDHRILKRNLLKGVGEWIVPPSNDTVSIDTEAMKRTILQYYRGEKKLPEGLAKEIADIFRAVPMLEIEDKHVRCVVSKFHYGMGSKDPLERVLFFSSKNMQSIGDWSDETAQPLEIKMFIFWDQNPTQPPSKITEEQAAAIKSRLHVSFQAWAHTQLQGDVRDSRLEHSANKNAKRPATGNKTRDLKINHSADFDPQGYVALYEAKNGKGAPVA